MLEAMLQRYAAKGAEDWRNMPAWKQLKAYSCLPRDRIATSVDAARNAVRSVVQNARGTGPQFIPMPDTSGNGLEHCLFAPIWRATDVIRFELLVVVDTQECLSLRFEIADPRGSAHCFPHAQFSRVLMKRGNPAWSVSPVGVPQFMPTRYPAFPVPGYDSWHLFAAMALSIHGYPGLGRLWHQEIWQGDPQTIGLFNNALEAIRTGRSP